MTNNNIKSSKPFGWFLYARILFHLTVALLVDSFAILELFLQDGSLSLGDSTKLFFWFANLFTNEDALSADLAT